MNNKTLHVEFYSYWHAGAGSGQGPQLDALVIKDKIGLPYLPGRTLKGLLRDAMYTCEEAHQVPPDTANRIFGIPGVFDGTEPGILYLSDAVLNPAERDWLSSADGQSSKAGFYDKFSSTKLTEDGLAEPHTLRSMELCIPINLEANLTLDGDQPADWKALEKACSLIRCLGSHRNRGLGRCRFTLKS